MSSEVEQSETKVVEVLKATADRIIRGERKQQPQNNNNNINKQLEKDQNRLEINKLKKKSGEELLAEAEARLDNLDESLELLDIRGLRRLTNSLERKLRDNMEARLKYSDDPEKFMESEVDLDAEIKRMMYISGTPELYPALVELGIVPKLLQLLSHENSDIVADVVELLADLSENDPEEDAEEEISVVLMEIKNHHGIELLVERIGKLKEADEQEAQTIHHILQLLSNIVEYINGAGDILVEKTPFIKLVEKKLQSSKLFDQNKGSYLEVVASTVTTSPQSRIRIGSFTTMDCLLKALHEYKNIKAADNSSKRMEEEEIEYIENIVDTLCYSLLLPANKTNFYNNEGVQLMILLIRKRSVVARSTIRLLSYAMQNFPPACEMFVDNDGLRLLFSIFMGKLKLSFKFIVQDEQQLDVLSVDMIANLLQYLPHGDRRNRVATKFVENEFEKCDRLLEIFWETYHELQGLDEMLDSYQDTQQDIEAQMSQLTMKLQSVCYIIVYLWSFNDTMLKRRIISLLHQRGYTMFHVGAVLRQQYAEVKAGLGTEDQDSVEGVIRRIEQLLQTIGEDLMLEEENMQPHKDMDINENERPREPDPEILPPLPPLPPQAQQSSNQQHQQKQTNQSSNIQRQKKEDSRKRNDDRSDRNKRRRSVHSFEDRKNARSSEYR